MQVSNDAVLTCRACALTHPPAAACLSGHVHFRALSGSQTEVTLSFDHALPRLLVDMKVGCSCLSWVLLLRLGLGLLLGAHVPLLQQSCTPIVVVCVVLMSV